MGEIVLVLLSLFVCQLSITGSSQLVQYTFFDHYCNNTATSKTYINDSVYENNLNRLFDRFTLKSSSLKFDNFTVGDASNKVYGLFRCRFDVSLDVCSACVKNATQTIAEDCPYYSEAIVWYYECTLWYANRTIFSLSEPNPGIEMCSERNVSNYAEFAPILETTMDSLIENASSIPAHFAYDETDMTLSDKLYSFAQCTPDINASRCETCLKDILRVITSYCTGNDWAMIFGRSCQVRYDTTYPILHGLDRSSPPPSDVNEALQEPTSTKTSLKPAIIGAIAASVSVGLLVLIVVLWICVCRKSPSKESNNVPPGPPTGRNHDETIESDVSHHLGDKEVVQYDFVTLKTATRDFSLENRLGEGGFGIVYKGTLEKGEDIAIKRLSNTSGQGTKEFMSEARLLAKLQHRSLVKFLGFCVEGDEKMLVYEFLPNSSLDRFLFDPEKRPHLNWVTRNKIIVGIARGLQYLHEDSRYTIIHRDLKPENILLDNEMYPKIADFGLARLFEQAQQFGNTIRIAGTRGYMAPECLLGEYSSKSDVYSFGVMLLEIVSGQSNKRFSQRSKEDLPIHAWILWNEERSIELVDPELDKTYSSKEIQRFIQIGLLCVQADAEQRPTMTEVVLMLTVGSIDLTLPSPPVVTVPQLNVAWANPTGQQSNSDQFSTKSITHDLYPNPR